MGHVFVIRDDDDGQNQQANYEEIQLATRQMRYRRIPPNILSPSDTIRGNFVRPRKQDGDGKSQDEGKKKYGVGPLRQAQINRQHIATLEQKPCDNQVGNGYPENVTPFEFAV